MREIHFLYVDKENEAKESHEERRYRCGTLRYTDASTQGGSELCRCDLLVKSSEKLRENGDVL